MSYIFIMFYVINKDNFNDILTLKGYFRLLHTTGNCKYKKGLLKEI